MHKGSCLCGQVAYEVEGDFEQFFLCHCGYCRKDTGSAHAANLFSKTATVKWLSGEQLVRRYNHKEAGHIRAFCSVCGSALPNLQMDGKLLVVPAGSLDTNVHIRPQGHIFAGSRANWDCELEVVQTFEKLPKK